MKGDIVAAGYSSHTEVATSGSLRIGMNRLFQAHLALESNLGFRLISGLENAVLCERLGDTKTQADPDPEAESSETGGRRWKSNCHPRKKPNFKASRCAPAKMPRSSLRKRWTACWN